MIRFKYAVEFQNINKKARLYRTTCGKGVFLQQIISENTLRRQAKYAHRRSNIRRQSHSRAENIFKNAQPKSKPARLNFGAAAFIDISPTVHCSIKTQKKCCLRQTDSTINVDRALSFRSVSAQVLSPRQSLTSVFGMGTGGPSALKRPTVCQRCVIFPERFRSGIVTAAELNFRVRNGNGWTLCAHSTDFWCTFRDSNPGPTD